VQPTETATIQTDPTASASDAHGVAMYMLSPDSAHDEANMAFDMLILILPCFELASVTQF